MTPDDAESTDSRAEIDTSEAGKTSSTQNNALITNKNIAPNEASSPDAIHSLDDALKDPEVTTTQVVLKERFVLEEMIARGGMGIVYKARDLRKEEYRDRDPYVAIKILNKDCKAHPDFFMALQRESRKAQRLAHPNIVTVHDFDADGDTVFMTMEYLTGQTLDVFIRENIAAPIDYKNIQKIVNDMGQGLSYAHKHHIVHCDFKPGNVFLSENGIVKILDFGISRVAQNPNKPSLDATIFDAGKFGALTPPYASCEMLEGGAPDPRDDIYALACITYELLTGRHPFHKEKATIARNKNMKADRIKGLNIKSWKGLLRGLEFDREARTPSVEQFLLEFQGESKPPGAMIDWKLSLGLAFIALITAISYFYLPTPVKTPVNNEVSTPTDPDKSSDSPTSDITANHLTTKEQNRIANLLEAAEVHFIVGRILEPPGSNAYDAYKQILAIDPNHKQAQAGLDAIANHHDDLIFK